MLTKLGQKGRNCWTVARMYASRPDKPLAEVRLSKGEYVVKPLKKLSKADSSHVAAVVMDLRLEACGEPPKGSDEALMGRLDADLNRLAGRLEDGGRSPELVGILDAAGMKLQEVREALRLMR